MIILAHRGYWKSIEEKNSSIAFKRALQLGFGIETDMRDYNGDLVIAHEIAHKNDMKARTFFELYKNLNSKSVLAINIKADGLQLELKALLQEFKIENYFVFDMSVPDALVYVRSGLTSYTRQSEYEHSPSFYDLAQGVWLDEFETHWITEKVLKEHMNRDKKLCIVSPELHGRDYHREWANYKQIINKLSLENIMLCTDFPEEAMGVFNE